MKRLSQKVLDDLIGAEVKMFRCHLDPMIGPKPRQAFVPSDVFAEAYWIGYWVYMKYVQPGKDRHIVPSANIQSIRIGPLDEEIEVSRSKAVKKSEAV